MSDQPTMVRRRDAAQATLDRFKDKPLRYGINDCVRMTAQHLRRMGHKVKLPASGAYRTPAGGLKQLKARGHKTLAEALDALGLERIAPAAAIVGDVLQLPGDHDLGALAIAMGNGRALAYHEDAIGAVVVQPMKIVAAWRV